MTLFAVFEPSGQLTQANKVYDPEGYDKLLDEHGYTYIAAETNTLPSFSEWYVDVKAKELTARPVMPIAVTKTVIKAGGVDSAVISGIPKQAKAVIGAAGAVLHNVDPLDATELEIAIPVPCVYRVTISLWPYRDHVIAIEAV
ncbi:MULTISPECIES: hypothetical protein [unclassified Bradyrhizobium]|uniref:hypothetical protein n=1 Tax=unclassified Bradyrhizobium TaxID=2631580 RepID=UPI00211EB737|nr:MULTISPECIES: hypothetical protein [unclassified Bradyrhizobium]MDD1534551.1 hypothetical protein [Bradyrhizobium sp. WBOS8]MDD1581415.1 hypothetical protein [Bradyrhizobium sp. WBOS4]UUO49705.1 hypothetical protein DCM78_24020 [Bradyrhizobium sp. WBOS04]UUO58470.1 hypothetical protein DCM80_04295 [Bradyrhizobium sp. WBOS08]